MDFTGIVGLIAGIVLIIYGILGGGELIGFFDLPSVFITFGGTIASTLIAFPISAFKNIPRHIAITLERRKYDPHKYIAQIVEFADSARRKGLLALEEEAVSLKDPFFREALMLVVDALDPAKVREILDSELDATDDRHAKGWEFYEKMASFAPAFGMIGTLIGLVNMLAGMDLEASGGSAKMAQGMATALLTTLYGSLLANLLLIPIANKLKMRHEEEMLCKQIVCEGALSILSGENPALVENRLNVFLSNKEREKAEAAGEGRGGTVQPVKESKPGRRTRRAG